MERATPLRSAELNASGLPSSVTPLGGGPDALWRLNTHGQGAKAAMLEPPARKNPRRCITLPRLFRNPERCPGKPAACPSAAIYFKPSLTATLPAVAGSAPAAVIASRAASTPPAVRIAERTA